MKNYGFRTSHLLIVLGPSPQVGRFTDLLILIENASGNEREVALAQVANCCCLTAAKSGPALVMVEDIRILLSNRVMHD